MCQVKASPFRHPRVRSLVGPGSTVVLSRLVSSIILKLNLYVHKQVRDICPSLAICKVSFLRKFLVREIFKIKPSQVICSFVI